MGLFPFLFPSNEGGVESCLGSYLDDLPPMGVILGESNQYLVAFEYSDDGVAK